MHRVPTLYILYNINKYFNIVANGDSIMWLLGNMKSQSEFRSKIDIVLRPVDYDVRVTYFTQVNIQMVD